MMHGSRTAPPLVVALASFLFLGDAHGAGFYLPDIGTRAMGRGGAFVARADDLTAAWYNPAGLALPGTRFAADGALVRKAIVFQRTDETGAPGSFARVDNTSGGIVVPFFAIASDFGLRNFAASLSVYAPFSGRYDFPANGAQRYSGIANNPLELYYQLSVAGRPLPFLKVGASFEVVSVRAVNHIAVAVLPGDEGTSDLRVKLEAADWKSLSGRFGLLATPTRILEFGASLKLPVVVRGVGTLTVDESDLAGLRATQPTLADLAISGNQVSLNFEMPLVVRAGVRVKLARFDVEADYVFERWTGFKRLEIVPKNINVTLLGTTLPLPTVVQDRNYGDGHSVRIGSDIEAVPDMLTLRLGAFYESPAVPTTSLNVSLVETPKFGATLGVTWRHRWLSVTAAYVYVHHAETQVLGSTSRQTNLTYLALGVPDQAPAVGNGIYRSWQNIWSIGVALDVDTLVGWHRHADAKR